MPPNTNKPEKGYEQIKTDSFFVESIEIDPILYGLHYKKFYFFFVVTLVSLLVLGFFIAGISAAFGSLGVMGAILITLYLLSRLYLKFKKKSGIKRIPTKKNPIRVNNKNTSAYFNGTY